MSIEDKWKEAEETGKPVLIGELVVCDLCNKDYTKLNDKGGFIFLSKAVCPDCAPTFLESIKSYGEEHWIKATCPIGKSFADFCREYRGPNSTISITKI